MLLKCTNFCDTKLLLVSDNVLCLHFREVHVSERYRREQSRTVPHNGSIVFECECFIKAKTKQLTS